jgi:hypothetical protein
MGFKTRKLSMVIGHLAFLHRKFQGLVKLEIWEYGHLGPYYFSMTHQF